MFFFQLEFLSFKRRSYNETPLLIVQVTSPLTQVLLKYISMQSIQVYGSSDHSIDTILHYARK